MTQEPVAGAGRCRDASRLAAAVRCPLVGRTPASTITPQSHARGAGLHGAGKRTPTKCLPRTRQPLLHHKHVHRAPQARRLQRRHLDRSAMQALNPTLPALLAAPLPLGPLQLGQPMLDMSALLIENACLKSQVAQLTQRLAAANAAASAARALAARAIPGAAGPAAAEAGWAGAARPDCLICPTSGVPTCSCPAHLPAGCRHGLGAARLRLRLQHRHQPRCLRGGPSPAAVAGRHSWRAAAASLLVLCALRPVRASTVCSEWCPAAPRQPACRPPPRSQCPPMLPQRQFDGRGTHSSSGRHVMLDGGSAQAVFGKAGARAEASLQQQRLHSRGQTDHASAGRMARPSRWL